MSNPLPAPSRTPLITRSNVTIACFVVLALSLSLSNRIPGVWRSAVNGFFAFGRTFERVFAVDFIDRGDIPWRPDEIGHLVFWGAGMIVVGLVGRRRWQADNVAVALFASSLAIEVLQGALSAQRTMSLSDAIANSTGIMLGLTVVVIARRLQDGRKIDSTTTTRP